MLSRYSEIVGLVRFNGERKQRCRCNALRRDAVVLATVLLFSGERLEGERGEGEGGGGRSADS